MITTAEVRTVTSSHDALGSGVSRTVYLLDDTTVLKVAHKHGCQCHNPIRSNKAEWMLWNKVKGTPDEVYFFQPLERSRDFRAVKFERAKGTINRVRAFDDQSYRNAKRACERLGVYDLHGENFGVREDGSVACLDYADNPFYHQLEEQEQRKKAA